MSHTQGRVDKSETQFRKQGRSGGGSSYNRGVSSGGGKGGGGYTAPAPPSSSTPSNRNNVSLSANRSFKKSGNGQEVQPGGSNVGAKAEVGVTTSFTYVRVTQNGSHNRPPLHGASNISTPTAKQPVEISTMDYSPAPPKAPSSGPPSSATPVTPAKGEAAELCPFQFGSISPVFMNGMQIPARTSSAPPNLDEQKRDQATRDLLKATPKVTISSTPKQHQHPHQQPQQLQQSKKDLANPSHPSTGDSHVKNDVIGQIPIVPTSAPAKSSGVSMPTSSLHVYQQPQVPIEFGGPRPTLHPQSIPAGSLHVPMSHQIFVHGIQSHPMHQGQILSFTPQMGHHIPPQMGNVGMGIGTQYPQQQEKYSASRTAVKITHPETHEELRLDKRSESHMVPPVQRSHVTLPPHSQSVHSINPTQVGYYPPNSYSPLYFTTPPSISLTNTTTTGSQSVRNNYSFGQTAHPVSIAKPSVPNTITVSKSGTPTLSIAGPMAPSVQITVKPPVTIKADRAGSTPIVSGMPVSKKEASRSVMPPGKQISENQQRVKVDPSVGEPREITGLLSNMTLSDKVVPEPCLIADSKSSSSGTISQKNEIASMKFLKDDIKTHNLDDSQTQQHHEVNASDSPCVYGSQSLNFLKQGTSYSSDIQQEKCFENTSVYGEASVTTDSTAYRYIHPKIEAAECKKDQATLPLSVSFTVTASKSTAENISVDFSNASEIDAVPHKGEYAKTNAYSCLEVVPKVMNNAESISSNRDTVTQVPLDPKLENEIPVGPVSNSKVSASLNSVSPALPCQQKKQGHGLHEKAVTEKLEKVLDDDYYDSSIKESNFSCKLQNRDSGADSTGKDISVTSVDPQKPFKVDEFVEGERMHSKDTTDAVGIMEISTVLPSNSFDTIEKPSNSIADSDSELFPGIKDKLPLEISSRKTISVKKKKMKAILSQADAIGVNSDLYNAYKGSNEKVEDVIPSESIHDSSIAAAALSSVGEIAKEGPEVEQEVRNKAEIDDWEYAADGPTPKLKTSESFRQGQRENMLHNECESISKKYSRDFLFKFSDKCIDLPPYFEIGPDIADYVIATKHGSSHIVDRESFPGHARIVDRPNRADRRTSNAVDDDKWAKSANAFPSIRIDGGSKGGNHGVLRNRGQFAGGILSGPVQPQAAQGGTTRSNVDTERWQRAPTIQRGLISHSQAPAPTIHKAENRYQVGKVSDKEEAKQRQLKAILNKLTPQNFDRLFEQVKEVNIDNAATLSGVISQIFDKALMEPTFCEMYADFCLHLSAALPDFSEENEKITFRRLLLNKCQEEFERGEREEAEANRAEEGEEQQSTQEKEAKKLQARRRTLGNIRLIGELYKKRMLTEKIMHECIRKLLGQSLNPTEEDIEALCKLMSTIGEMIDHLKAKAYMDSYFEMMRKLSINEKYSSRVRFMLKDAIDLRKNKWQQRRKVEGPKKIEEVHRDAAQERQSQASRSSRGSGTSSSTRRSVAGDYGSRGPSSLPSLGSQHTGSLRVSPQARGYGTQDIRMEDRHPTESRVLSFTSSQRTIHDDSIMLGPQGGLAKGMSSRRQPSNPNASDYRPGSSGSQRLAPNGIGNRDAKKVDHAFETLSNNTSSIDHVQDFSTGSNVTTSCLLSEDLLREKSILTIREYYSAKDEREVALCIQELNSPSFYPSMVSLWVTDSFERKDIDRDLLSQLLVNLCNSRDCLLGQAQLMQGFESVLASLEDTINDAPRAGEFFGRMLGKLILENVIPFRDVGLLIHKGGEEPGRLLEIGLAADVLSSVLETMVSMKGEAVVNEIRSSSGLCLEDFQPPGTKSMKLDPFLQR